ncbi:hypothetical protein [Xylocopilactobacillus apicola]|uniref:Uncharacterized protein n=1 Tax=Xylocopilactobacillus apicola TaxID=2932184 RepID=A0AAU9DHF8_9LACO|nr:hypothetical protein [Xylocopilactobacillus apicola]BDR59430.1 hypothetical protein XA3_18710 [Xylocopilactobacillus apicola]
MMNEEEKESSSRKIEQAYQEELDKLNLQAKKVGQESEDMVQKYIYWLRQLNLNGSNREIYQIADRYQNEAQDAINQAKRKLTSSYENKVDELNREYGKKDENV